jgi:hypothetical protein
MALQLGSLYSSRHRILIIINPISDKIMRQSILIIHADEGEKMHK